MLAQQEAQLKKVPILIMINKYDSDSKMSVDQITDHLNLSEIGDREWCIFKTSAKTGAGLQEAMNWLSDTLTKSR